MADEHYYIADGPDYTGFSGTLSQRRNKPKLWAISVRRCRQTTAKQKRVTSFFCFSHKKKRFRSGADGLVPRGETRRGET